jgi:hypothetical protein
MMGALHAQEVVRGLIPNPRVILQRVVQKADGGTITFQRIEPPVLASLPVQPPVVASGSSGAIPPVVGVRRQVLTLTARVFVEAGSDEVISEVQWEHEGRRFVAWSTLDFRWVNGLGDFDVGTDRWAVLALARSESREMFEARSAARMARDASVAAGVSVPMAPLPVWPSFSPEVRAGAPAGLKAWYGLVSAEGCSSVEEVEAGCAVMDALHSAAEVKWEALRAWYAAEQVRMVQEAMRARLPVVPTHEVIQFWKEEVQP